MGVTSFRFCGINPADFFCRKYIRYRLGQQNFRPGNLCPRTGFKFIKLLRRMVLGKLINLTKLCFVTYGELYILLLNMRRLFNAKHETAGKIVNNIRQHAALATLCRFFYSY